MIFRSIANYFVTACVGTHVTANHVDPGKKKNENFRRRRAPHTHSHVTRTRSDEATQSDVRDYTHLAKPKSHALGNRHKFVAGLEPIRQQPSAIHG